ncbi:unnamed protein product [Pleuronectes platessa]|uniref:Uncharacterized protein n=1 Tax=Pleuronectes platessa TaxID=8262 RepID=A0A9N7YMW1_PLEPL|nr:unnamed protein product [Pleuronectes platessa]
MKSPDLRGQTSNCVSPDPDSCLTDCEGCCRPGGEIRPPACEAVPIFKTRVHAADKKTQINSTSRRKQILETNGRWELKLMAAKGLIFILIRTSQASGLHEGERRSQVALTAYPLLMEAYRLNRKEASVTGEQHRGTESAYARTRINVSVFGH